MNISNVVVKKEKTKAVSLDKSLYFGFWIRIWLDYIEIFLKIIFLIELERLLIKLH